jgi:hypothetical protein
MVQFINKTKIKWEWNNIIESKMRKKKSESPFSTNKMSKEKLRKKTTAIYLS